MHSTFRFAVKACLVAAVSGAVFNQAIGLPAQDDAPAPRDASAAPKIRQTAGVQGANANATAASPSTTSDGTSEVQKKLQELYRKNGREMPSMNMNDLPNTQAQVPTAAAPVQVAPNGPIVAPSRAAAKPGKPNWFERTFRVGRGRKPAPAVVQPTRPNMPAAQPQQRYAPVQPALRPAAPTYRAPVATATPLPQTPAQPVPTAQPGLREPTPIGIPGGVSDLTARPAARSGQRSGISPPLMDESDPSEDSETLDLSQDDQPKFANQAPQIIPNKQAAKGSESPYTGLTISPGEMEQKVANTIKPFEDPTRPAATALPSAPAGLAPGNDTGKTILKPLPIASAPAARGDDVGMDEDDDDDDDDDAPLTLPVDDAAKTPAKSAQPAEKPAKEGEKPAKEIEKPAVPMKGFRGYCPVVLKEDRKLIEAKADITSEYHGKIYCFSSIEAKEVFDESPLKYIPAGDGIDVVRHAASEETIEGTLEHAAWYRGRLYLFSSADTRREFVETPSKFSIHD